MDINDVETAEQSHRLLQETNFWVDTGNQALFFIVDANFFILLPILCFKMNQYTILSVGFSFVLLSILRKKDITFNEFLVRIRVTLAGSKYRRRK